MKRTSPFADYQSEPLTTTPMGMSPQEYLQVWGEGAAPEEWVELARSFLANMEDSGV